ncbi:hypothetical protein ACFYSI_13570 [Staphylococcus xylosus]|mgnify:CR=1 FL=1|uniref:hypothetical protein n=1 Tax=Staphylococcus xylosus TaxID=1288 RepID=UPI003680887E
MKTTKNLFIYIGLPLVVLVLFIWQLDNLEKFFKHYPNAIDGATLVFVLITTTLSIVIAYKSYSSNIKLIKDDKIKQSYKVKRLVYVSIKELIYDLNEFLKTYENYEHESKSEVITMYIEKFNIEDKLSKAIEKTNKIREEKIDTLILEDDKELEDNIRQMELIKIAISLYYSVVDIKDFNKESTEKTLMNVIKKFIEYINHKE